MVHSLKLLALGMKVEYIKEGRTGLNLFIGSGNWNNSKIGGFFSKLLVLGMKVEYIKGGRTGLNLFISSGNWIIAK